MFVGNCFFFLLYYMIDPSLNKKKYLLMCLLLPLTFFVELFTDISEVLPIIGGYFILKEKNKSNIVLLNKLLLCMLTYDSISLVSSLTMTSIFSFEGIKGYGYVLFQIMLDCLLLLIFIFLYRKLDISKIVEQYSSKITAIFMIYLLTIGLFVSYVAHQYQVFDHFVFGVLVFLIIQMFVVLFLFIRITIRQREQYEQQLKRKELVYLKKYTDSLEKDQEKFAKFRHDYKNLLLSLKEIANQNHDSLLEKEIKELEIYSNYYLTNKFEYRYLKNIKNDYLKSLFIAKLYQANNNKICCKFECPSTIVEVPVPIFDCIRVLGIILDNAIEASTESQDRELSLAIYRDDKQIEISISNSCKELLLSIDTLMKKGITTKKGHQGLGLSSIEEINKKNPNMFVNYQNDPYQFATQVILLF
ncbi:GHKL domain-containing protein [Enterococcus sp. BWB1-3]|uniref:sensor histidine kinase n=1 Tax=Enterococcus sp. BWT-B8 TaxID=2885157 RepID=UPI001924DE29|nr:GHKL domain-containing protein [Enterococcus sp. BWT-B8]MBL1231045.1 GHKL domain-containing protein [Enterococcus sp. BWB1-3]